MALHVSRVAIAFLAFIVTTGCRTNIESGIYQGTLIETVNQEQKEELVRIKLQRDSHYQAKIEVYDIGDTLLKEATLLWRKSHDRIQLTLPNTFNAPLVLTRTPSKKNDDAHWKCYEGKNRLSVLICFGKQEFLFHLIDPASQSMVFSLTGDLSAPQGRFFIEDPQKFTLSEAIERVQTKSFDAQIEYEKLIQARETTKAAYINLLPHFNFKDAVAASALNPKAMINFAADFVPFVIPTRWLKLKEAKHLRKAEEITLDILRADLTNQISSLGYIYTQDWMDYCFYEDMIQKGTELLERIHELQDTSPLAFKQLKQIEYRLALSVNASQQQLERLTNALDLDRTSLALFLGFHNSQAVSHFDVGSDHLSIDDAVPLEEEKLSQMMRERSLELKQIDEIYYNAHNQKNEYYFNWMDPDVAPAQSISLSLIPLRARAKSVMRELMKKREYIQSQVSKKAIDAIMTHNFTLDQYRVIQEGLTSSAEMLHSYCDLILNGTPAEITAIPPGDIEWTFRTYIQYKTNAHAILAKYRMTQAQIRRLLFQDYYSRAQIRSTKEMRPNSP